MKRLYYALMGILLSLVHTIVYIGIAQKCDDLFKPWGNFFSQVFFMWIEMAALSVMYTTWAVMQETCSSKGAKFILKSFNRVGLSLFLNVLPALGLALPVTFIFITLNSVFNLNMDDKVLIMGGTFAIFLHMLWSQYWKDTITKFPFNKYAFIVMGIILLSVIIVETLVPLSDKDSRFSLLPLILYVVHSAASGILKRKPVDIEKHETTESISAQ